MEKKKRLTNNQKKLYDLLININKFEWKMPTLLELSRLTGKTKSTLWETLKNIEKRGYIKIEKNKKRGITLILEEESNDEYIYFCEDDIEKEENVKHGFSKSNKQSRGSIWS